ncbi:MAG TPA: hypothetical protein VHC39_14285 [Rhizomicrobium sp.]|nr:hypothetical protein [Rhizomicrobium sp.]
MTRFIKTTPRSDVTEFIAEAFNAVTIALVGVLGILTVAATI